jgi:hypothetical protein
VNRSALRAYLNDHLAGSTSALDLVRRRASSAEGDLGTVFEGLAAELELEQRFLRRAMAAARLDPQPHKQALAVATAWIDVLRPRRQPPNLVRDLEVMATGVRGKELLWATIRALSAVDTPMLDPEDLARLEEMATTQSRELRRQHDLAVRRELAGRASAPI